MTNSYSLLQLFGSVLYYCCILDPGTLILHLAGIVFILFTHSTLLEVVISYSPLSKWQFHMREKIYLSYWKLVNIPYMLQPVLTFLTFLVLKNWIWNYVAFFKFKILVTPDTGQMQIFGRNWLLRGTLSCGSNCCLKANKQKKKS